MPLMTSSQKYRVFNDYEAAYIHCEGQAWKVGEFYGDPCAALVTWDEQWALIVGEGVLLVHLPLLNSAPQRAVHFDTDRSLSGAFKIAVERGGVPCLSRLLMGRPGSVSREATWFEAVYQVDRHMVRLVADPYGNEPGIYQIDLATFDIARIFPVQHA